MVLVVVQIIQMMSRSSRNHCISQYCRHMYRFTSLGEGLCDCDCCTKMETCFVCFLAIV